MCDARRPMGRLFLLVLLAVSVSEGQTPPLTTITDQVYRADGTAAQGTLLITWPEFTTSAGQAVAAGNTSVTLGAGGVLSVALVANVNATPPDTVYTVVSQLDDGTVRTEFWIVPTTSPATLAEVRTTLGTPENVSQLATQQFVTTAVASKANDSAVVHLTGSETITGSKQFSVAPGLPNPVQPGDAANKQYVDNSVQNVGSGNFLSLSGGTMSGALTLSGDPVAPLQAVTKHYSDLSAAVKADLIAGLVPPTELGSGTPNSATCLLGNQTWGPCSASGSGSVYVNSALIANPNFNATTPAPQSNFLNCTFQSGTGTVSLECPYGNGSSSFALGSQAVLKNQANAFSSGLQDFSVARLKLPSGAGFAPATNGEIGFDTTANLPVIAISGVTQQIALTTSNISGQASTALALAGTPAQCNGSFATGIQANGNANCSVADVIQLAEQVELGGAWIMQHGDVEFNAASDGVIGGLYAGNVSVGGCLAGFRVTPTGAQSNIQALVNGAVTGLAMMTMAGHHYVLTTRLYSDEIYRRQQIFHSSLHPAGSGRGGAEIAAGVRIVLEVHDIDPANPGSEIAPSSVLYDGLIASAPDFCTYATINSANLQCAITFTRMIQAVDAEVRSALPGQGYRTRLVGALADGAECNITSTGGLEFYTAYVPAANEAISVHYRGARRALAWVINPASIAAQQRGFDDGRHGAVRHVRLPAPRTSADCEIAALALLDDTCGPAWLGEYDIWSDFLPGNASDIFPGDGLSLNIPSRGGVVSAIVREVDIEVRDIPNERNFYSIKFANDAAIPLGFEIDKTPVASLPELTQITTSQVGVNYLADLSEAEVTVVASTTIAVDTGMAPGSGGGFEVRWSDAGWGPDNDRNLVGRFANQTFTLPRLSQLQNYYLRQYNASSPPLYSRATTALHVDYPL